MFFRTTLYIDLHIRFPTLLSYLTACWPVKNRVWGVRTLKTIWLRAFVVTTSIVAVAMTATASDSKSDEPLATITSVYHEMHGAATTLFSSPLSGSFEELARFSTPDLPERIAGFQPLHLPSLSFIKSELGDFERLIVVGDSLTPEDSSESSKQLTLLQPSAAWWTLYHPFLTKPSNAESRLNFHFDRGQQLFQIGPALSVDLDGVAWIPEFLTNDDNLAWRVDHYEAFRRSSADSSEKRPYKYLGSSRDGKHLLAPIASSPISLIRLTFLDSVQSFSRSTAYGDRVKIENMFVPYGPLLVSQFGPRVTLSLSDSPDEYYPMTEDHRQQGDYRGLPDWYGDASELMNSVHSKLMSQKAKKLVLSIQPDKQTTIAMTLPGDSAPKPYMVHHAVTPSGEHRLDVSLTEQLGFPISGAALGDSRGPRIGYRFELSHFQTSGRDPKLRPHSLVVY